MPFYEIYYFYLSDIFVVIYCSCKIRKKIKNFYKLNKVIYQWKKKKHRKEKQSRNKYPLKKKDKEKLWIKFSSNWLITRTNKNGRTSHFITHTEQ